MFMDSFSEGGVYLFRALGILMAVVAAATIASAL